MPQLDLTIRPAQPADIAPLQQLIQCAYRGASGAASWSHAGEMPEGVRIDEAELERLVADPSRSLSVAFDDARLVGSSLVESLATSVCTIGLLAVDPETQGLGVGDQLLRHAESLAISRYDAKCISIEVVSHKANLLGWYERRGYVQTGETKPYPHQLSAPAHFLVLEKPLQA